MGGCVLQDDGRVVCLKKELSPSMTDPFQELVTYTVDVCTSQLPGSGTEANAFIELLGSKGSTGKERSTAIACACARLHSCHCALYTPA